MSTSVLHRLRVHFIYLNISFGLVSNFHDKLRIGVNHVLQDALIDTATSEIMLDFSTEMFTYTAPKLSELETKRYSFPSANSWSSTPECTSAL